MSPAEKMEQVIAAVHALDALKAELASLQQKIADGERELNLLLGGEQHPAQSGESSASRETPQSDHQVDSEDRFRVPQEALDTNRSLIDRISLFLKANPDYNFSAEDVRESLTDANFNSIRSALYRLAKDKNEPIESTGRGLYASTEG